MKLIIQKKSQPLQFLQLSLRKKNYPIHVQRLSSQTNIFKPYKLPFMHNCFFNNKNASQSQSKLDEPLQSVNITPIITPLAEEDCSNNLLNIGFIADESKFVFSDSQSVKSSDYSVSGVSEIRSVPKRSPHIMNNFDEQISGLSGMDEWSQNSQICLQKRDFKRNKPERIEDEAEIQTNLKKKKRSDRNKVLTIDTANKAEESRGYMLRSRSKCKLMDDENSSNQDIRSILETMEKPVTVTRSCKSRSNQKRRL